MKRASKGYTGVDILLFQTMLVLGPIIQDEAASTGVDVRHGGAATTVTSLDTKKIYGAAYNKLVKKVKKVEKTVQSSQAGRRARIVVFDDEDDLEDSSKQGRNGHDMEVDTAEPVYTTSASITTASITISTASPRRVFLLMTLIWLRHWCILGRVQLKTKRIARVHETASSFNIQEWEDIQARVEADEEGVPELVADSSQAAVKEAGGLVIKDGLDGMERDKNHFIPSRINYTNKINKYSGNHKEQ
nr:hypothetical protein [Tanacetum cinerariifolium]